MNETQQRAERRANRAEADLAGCRLALGDAEERVGRLLKIEEAASAVETAAVGQSGEALHKLGLLDALSNLSGVLAASTEKKPA